MKEIKIVLSMLLCLNVKAQDTTITPLSFSAYAEIYYSYDLNKPSGNDRPAFLYSHNRHNEFNLNLGFLKAAYSTKLIRANLAIAAGTYVNANYANEPGTLKNIFEANAGVKLARKKNLWLDAGIFNSHIGFESAVSKDCWTLTRSIAAENSPYYEAGVKITYTSDNNRLLLSALALNGWQRIKRVDDNSLMSFGTQIQYRPNTSTLINYSTFIGTDKPDSARLMRYFNNLYAVFNVNSKLGLTAGLDVGMEQKQKGSNALNLWYTPVIILQYKFRERWSAAARAEYYSDNDGVLVTTATGFNTAGYSLNADYAPSSKLSLRMEVRWLHSVDKLFKKNDDFTRNNTAITASMAVNLSTD